MLTTKTMSHLRLDRDPLPFARSSSNLILGRLSISWTKNSPMSPFHDTHKLKYLCFDSLTMASNESH